MDKVLHHKVVAALPEPLVPDSIYYVRKGSGFDMYVTNGLGVVSAYELNKHLSGVDLIRTPVAIEPLTSGGLVSGKPTLSASQFAPVYSVDTRSYRRFEVALSSDTGFASPVFAKDVNADSATVIASLAVSTSYIWRCKDVSASGDSSEWSIAQTMITEASFNSYIPTPTPTPAIGAPLEGGFYMGMFWNQIAQCSDSKTLATGTQTFTVPDMNSDPIVYYGQMLEVRSRANPANRFKGVVTGANGAELTLNVTSIEGGGTFSDWSVMSRFRNIVAPKSSGENPSIAMKNTNSALPVECKTLSDGWLATESMRLAGDATVYPAAHWSRALSIGGYTDWHIPTRDVLELCWRYGKTAAEANYVGTNRVTGFDYKKDGSSGDTSTSHGVNNSSEPVGVAYTAGSPAQTSATSFREGGAEAFIYGTSFYLSSTDLNSSSIWYQYWYAGSAGRQGNSGKTTPHCVRAVRRSII